VAEKEEAGMKSGLDWLTKAEAGNLTKVSLRTLEREIAAGSIRTKQRRQVGRRSVTVLHPKDVERLKGDFTPLAPPVTELVTVDSEEESPQLPALRSATDILTAIIQNLRPLMKEQRRFLTVDEAATYTGLPEGYLWKLIHNKKLKPVDHGAYYLRVADLDKL
jgi:excisionase family DNA binding protein